jgi:membrane protein involved in colicin uptake
MRRLQTPEEGVKKASAEASVKASAEASTEASAEALTKASAVASAKASAGISSEVLMSTLPEALREARPRASTLRDHDPKALKEDLTDASMEDLTEASTEALPKLLAEAHPEADEEEANSIGTSGEDGGNLGPCLSPETGSGVLPHSISCAAKIGSGRRKKRRPVRQMVNSCVMAFASSYLDSRPVGVAVGSRFCESPFRPKNCNNGSNIRPK